MSAAREKRAGLANAPARAPWFAPLDEDEAARAVTWATGRVEEGHHHHCAVNSGRDCDCYFGSGMYQAARLIVATEAANSQSVPE